MRSAIRKSSYFLLSISLSSLQPHSIFQSLLKLDLGYSSTNQAINNLISSTNQHNLNASPFSISTILDLHRVANFLAWEFQISSRALGRLIGSGILRFFKSIISKSVLTGKRNMGAASRAPKLSGIQKQVLGLYREFLRAARSKSAEDRKQIEVVVSEEFRRNSTEVDRKNFQYIEYLLRRGKHQLDQLKSPSTDGLSSLNVQSSAAK